MLFKFEKNEEGSTLTVEDMSLKQTVCVSLLMVSCVYERLNAANPELAKLFRKMMTVGIIDPGSLVWSDSFEGGVGSTLIIDEDELRKQMRDL